MKRKRQKGGAILEFAIGSALMLSLFAGTFEFGLTFYRYNLVLNAVRNAGQYASLRSYDSPTSTPSAAFRTAVANMAVYGSPDGGTTPVVPGLRTSNINVDVIFRDRVPASVKVTVTSYTVDAIFKTRTFANKPTMEFPYLGRYSPYVP